MTATYIALAIIFVGGLIYGTLLGYQLGKNDRLSSEVRDLKRREVAHMRKHHES